MLDDSKVKMWERRVCGIIRVGWVVRTHAQTVIMAMVLQSNNDHSITE
jgi:hypothetical protein